MKLLEVRNLKVAVDGREILHGLDLNIEAGETVVLLGKNGAGKSTLAAALSGTLPEGAETSGKITFAKKDLSKASANERAAAGIFASWQAPVEIPGLTTAELLRTALEEQTKAPVPRQEIEAKIASAAKVLKLDAFAPGREFNLGASGGEKKKNEILQLLILAPKLAILDEVDSGLDLNSADVVSRALADYQKKVNATLLVITHNFRILKHLQTSRVLLLDSGRISETGGGELIEKIQTEGFPA